MRLGFVWGHCETGDNSVSAFGRRGKGDVVPTASHVQERGFFNGECSPVDRSFVAVVVRDHDEPRTCQHLVSGCPRRRSLDSQWVSSALPSSSHLEPQYGRQDSGWRRPSLEDHLDYVMPYPDSSWI
jgi:hypothetical protein